MDLGQMKDERLLTRSQRMLARLGATVPKCPEDRRGRGIIDDKENDFFDGLSDGPASPFSPSEYAFITGTGANSEDHVGQQPILMKTNITTQSSMLQGNHLNLLASPKPNLARLRSLVPDYSPSSSATSNRTISTEQSASVSLGVTRQHLIPKDDFTLPVRKRKLLDNLVVMDEIEEESASTSATLMREVLSAPTLGTVEVNKEKSKGVVKNAVIVVDSAPEPTTLPETNGQSRISLTDKTPSTMPTATKEDCLNVGKIERTLPAAMATFSKNGQPNRANVQQNKPKPVKVSCSTADPRTSVASNGLILGKANERKPTNTASQRANARSEFIPPRILNSSNKPNQGDKQDELSDTRRKLLAVAKNQQPHKDHAIQNVSKNLFQECDDSHATSDDELFRNEDVDEEFDPSWKPDEDNEDDDDDDILASEDEEPDGNESVPLNVPEHESDAGTQSDEVADDEADQEAADETPKTISK
ncbi:Vacuolar membrane protease [Frankliniella fusca]|uniref:Vacuolar membrane protease n=1 Tax=Frankliniella fusca TaxID=407009 RepID=A0AAE1H1K1_9NEOP|nr:Vacuolar membrane protease [Frankliniella fusca]